jgi:hypothetical protein
LELLAYHFFDPSDEFGFKYGIALGLELKSGEEKRKQAKAYKPSVLFQHLEE